MKNNYYKKRQFIARVNRKGEILGKIEKWEAHKKGILHRALSVVLIYKNHYIIQHRKHPAFDGVFDLTSSTHQLFIKNKLQTSEEAVMDCLKREWGLTQKDITGKVKLDGEIYYKAKDPLSIYIEHEICEMLSVKLKKLPESKYDFAYGFSMVDKKTLNDKNSLIYKNLAPWSKKALKMQLI
jgi:isopentenyldiphosphate isomerase